MRPAKKVALAALGLCSIVLGCGLLGAVLGSATPSPVLDSVTTPSPAVRHTTATSKRPAVRHTTATSKRPAVRHTTTPAVVWYADCSEARAAGAAPLHRDDLGYRLKLDRNRDGVACE